MSRRLNLSAGKFPTLSKIAETDNEPMAAALAASSPAPRVVEDNEAVPSPLTPITSIVRDLGRSRLSPSACDADATPATSDKCRIARHSNNSNNFNGLFRNAFKIKGTPESAVKASCSNSSRSSSAKRARRLIGMANSSRNSSPALLAAAPTKQLAASDDNSNSSCGSGTGHENECAAIFSPNQQNSTPHKPGGFKLSKPRFPLEEFDPNSQDCGYSSCTSFNDENQAQTKPGKANFQFAEPLGVAPRRLSLESRSPMKSSPVRSSPQRKRPALFRSLSSGYESTDDGFNDLIDMESLENDCSQLPNGLSSLISGNIVATAASNDSSRLLDPSAMISTTPEASKASRPRLAIRRSLSLQLDRSATGDEDDEAPADDERSPPSSGSGIGAGSKARSCLFRSPNASCSAAKLGFSESPRLGCEPGIASPPPSRRFKRPEPPCDEHTPVLVKRSRKCTSFQDVRRDDSSPDCSPARLLRASPPPVLQRSYSEPEAHAHIKHAITRSTLDSDLTGDFSKPCVLPLASSQHEDLKSISAETLVGLMRGEFADRVSDFRIVDCRYPYEYEAGHIEGALNLYNKEMIEKFLLDPLQGAPAIEPDSQSKRSILVFHCEFSWERGPNLSRFLRSVDRQRNKEHYPALHYPEVYLLHGGYQQFYKQCRDLCTGGYRPMRHPDHEADLKLFRSKSKSWQGEKANRPNVVNARANLKRLGF